MYGAQSGEFVCRSWGLKGEKRALMEVGGKWRGGGGVRPPFPLGLQSNEY